MSKTFHTPARNIPDADLPAMPTAPSCHENNLSWGDCDPAQIADAGTIPNFALYDWSARGLR